MTIFNLAEYKYLVPDLSGSKKDEVGKYKIKKFGNGTSIISIETSVEGKRCAVFGGATHLTSLFETLLLCHTLKKEGARQVTAIIPFIPYARQDENKKGESWGMKWLSEMLASSGVNEVITIDIHSKLAAELGSLPIVSLSSAEILARPALKIVKRSSVCVAPDEGAIDNCIEISEKLGMTAPVAHFSKKRSSRGKVRIISFMGKAGEEAVIADDIIDTGSTLVEACKRLKKAGVRKITVFASHGVFDGKDWKKSFGLGVDRIYCTDSNPAMRRLDHPKVKIVSIKNLIAEHLIPGL